MNREEKENIKYFEEMCDTLSNKKIMFREWENFYKKTLSIAAKNAVLFTSKSIIFINRLSRRFHGEPNHHRKP